MFLPKGIVEQAELISKGWLQIRVTFRYILWIGIIDNIK